MIEAGHLVPSPGMVFTSSSCNLWWWVHHFYDRKNIWYYINVSTIDWLDGVLVDQLDVANLVPLKVSRHYNVVESYA